MKEIGKKGKKIHFELVKINYCSEMKIPRKYLKVLWHTCKQIVTFEDAAKPTTKIPNRNSSNLHKDTLNELNMKSLSQSYFSNATFDHKSYSLL
jgi:hypothetical protein